MDLLIIYGNARESAAYWKSVVCNSESLLSVYYELWQEAEEMTSKAYAMIEKTNDNRCVIS